MTPVLRASPQNYLILSSIHLKRRVIKMTSQTFERTLTIGRYLCALEHLLVLHLVLQLLLQSKYTVLFLQGLKPRLDIWRRDIVDLL